MTHLDTRSDQSPPPEEAYDELKLPAVLIRVGAASMVIAGLTVVANFVGLLLAVGNATGARRVPAYIPPRPAYGPVGMAQINAVVKQITTTWPTPPPLNAAQQATLINELKSPSQQLLPPSPNQFPVATVIVGSDGTTTIVFQSQGQISIDAQGTTIHKTGALYIPPPYQPPPIVGISQSAMTLTLVDSLLSALLAFLLLIAGIQTLRGSRSGSLLHHIYAYIKLPLTILGAIAAVALSQKVSQDSAGNATLFDTPFSLVTPTIILAVALLSVAYPILLLIVFRQSKVRTFYRRVIWN